MAEPNIASCAVRDLEQDFCDIILFLPREVKSLWSCCLILKAACPDEVRCLLQVLMAAPHLLSQVRLLRPCLASERYHGLASVEERSRN